MSKIEMKLDLNAVRQIERGLKVLGGPAVRRVVKRATNFAMTPVLRTAKARVPVREGLLKKSLGRKRTFNKAKGTATVLVGPRVGFAKEIDGQLHDPARYGYMVEHGSRTAPAQSFLRAALIENETTVVTRFRENAGAGMEREIVKLLKSRKK